MLIAPKRLFATGFITVLATVFVAGASVAQTTTSDIWRSAPANALLVAGYDGRCENPSVQAIIKAETPDTQSLRTKQQAAMRKAVEDLATLFGVSLDFAKDILPWADDQWMVVIVPEAKGKLDPVFMMASKNTAAADATLQKILAPWQRVGDITTEPGSEYSISAFKTGDKSVEIYVSATGPVVAFSPSKTAIVQALKGGGLAAGSTGEKALNTLAGSMFYAYAEPGLLQEMGQMVPVSGIGLGLSAVDTGMKLRVLGYPNQQGAMMLKQVLSAQQPGVLTTNPGIPSTSLLAASLPDVSGLVAMAGLSGMAKDPSFEAIQAIADTRVSGALTAALPIPAGVVSAMAASEQAATEKLEKIIASAKALGMPVKPAKSIAGVQATAVAIPDGPTVYLAQIGRQVVLASDVQSLSSAAGSAKGEQPSLADVATYKETMAGLGDSNLLTVYANLAPIRGLGFLANGLGLGQLDPFCGSVADSLENLQALGLGVGYDGETVNATLFLRAKPGFGPTIGPAAVSAMAVGSAVMFPVFARARDAARLSACSSDLNELGVAARMYASDHNGKLPKAIDWQYEFEDYMPHQRGCPSDEAVYAFNKNLGGLNMDDILNPSEVVMFFEAAPELLDAAGSRADALLPHNGQGYFLYVDGHVQKLSEVPSQSHWVPKYNAPKPTKKAPAKRASMSASGSR